MQEQLAISVVHYYRLSKILWKWSFADSFGERTVAPNVLYTLISRRRNIH